jgi:amino-acid N-acetyltransferase
MHPMQIARIEPQSHEMDAARELLDGAALPTDDLAEPHVWLWGAAHQGQLIGSVGLEQAGRVGLLRSLVVAPAWRGNGLASRLCRFAFERARDAQLEALYLLSESAVGYFSARGFVAIDRADAPPEIAATRQFSSLCPGDADFMHKQL